MRKSIILLIILLCFSSLLLHAGGDAPQDLRMYTDGNYKMARMYAEKNLNDPMSQLIFALCQVNDVKNQELYEGLDNLKKLYGNEEIEKKIRLEAGFSYIRNVHILQIRGRHPRLKDIDTVSLYKEFIKFANRESIACMAAVYLADIHFESYSNNSEKGEALKAFRFLEDFSKNWKGNKKSLVPVYLFLDNYYIEVLNDYARSFNVLKKCYSIGITKEKIRREVLLKMGRMCDIKLGKKPLASKYYREFLRLYPNSETTAIVKQFLRNLRQQGVNR